LSNARNYIDHHHHARKNAMRSILLALLLLIASGAVLYAQPGGRGERGRPDLREQMEKLDLTPEQKAALRDIRVAMRKQMIDLRADLQKKRLEIGERMQEDAADRNTVEGLTREIADIQVRQKMLLFDSRQDIMKLLSEEQRQKFRDMERQGQTMRRERMKDRFRDSRD
jgi:protein CpxP